MSLSRYFRFSLRTLLLAVTGISLWLGWEARVVHERREVRRLMEEKGSIAPPFRCGVVDYDYVEANNVSPIRAFFGDESLDWHTFWVLRSNEQADRELERRVRKAYPEVHIAWLLPWEE